MTSRTTCAPSSSEYPLLDIDSSHLAERKDSRARETPPTPLDIHLVCDNYATHKTEEINTWLARYPRCHIRFTPLGRPGSTRSNAGSA